MASFVAPRTDATLPRNKEENRSFLLRNPDALIALALTLVCGFTRYLALPASLWEWDDFLFVRALHRFDLPSHSPHPPGFPVFVMMTRAANFLLHNDHLALALVSTLFATALGAGLYYFYLALLPDRTIAVSATLLCIFAPNVWVFSGAGRSDEVSFSLGVIGSALMLRGSQSATAFLSGCALLGIGMGVRVTLLPVMGLIVILVSLVRLSRKQWRIILLGAMLSVAGVLSWYVPMVWHTTLPVYQETSRLHAQYVFATDSIFSATESGILAYRFSRFFIDIWGEWKLAIAIYLVALLGLFLLLVRRQWRVLGWGLVCFLPFIIFTLIFNAPISAPFYAMPYIPLFTGLAACGLLLPFQWFRKNELRYLGLVLVGGAVLGLVNWSLPLVRLLHKEISPPVQAIRSLAARLDGAKDKLYFDELFTPHVSYFLPNHQTTAWVHEQSLALNLIQPASEDFQHIYLLSPAPFVGGVNEQFQWSAGRGQRRLRELSMGRYFDVYVAEVTAVRNVTFAQGWFQPEVTGLQSWRWMGKQATVGLTNEAEEMVLHLQGRAVDLQEPNKKPVVVLKLDGREIARATGPDVNQTLQLKTDPQRVISQLTIETDTTFIPQQKGLGADARELGFQCFALNWKPAANTPRRKYSDDEFLGAGWAALKQAKPRSWRWADEKAVVHLPAVTGNAQLQLILKVPAQPDGSRAKVKVSVAGQALAEIDPPDGFFLKTYQVPALLHQGRPTELLLQTAGSVPVQGESRKQALAVSQVTWMPAP